MFVCSFNLRSVTRHTLTPAGSSYVVTSEPFLSADSADFHPTDVIEDADGSLLVVDTGGWYTLCCPTSQLEKPDVPGAIYRIRRRDAQPINDPRGLGIDWRRVDLKLAVASDLSPVVSLRAASLIAVGDPLLAAIDAARGSQRQAYGRVVAGIIQEEGSSHVVVQTSATTRETVDRMEIEAIAPGTASLMPAGYEKLLSPQEIADLVAFLERAR